ncbi:MAG: threonine--tRNA ligase [Rickettsiales bacterium]
MIVNDILKDELIYEQKHEILLHDTAHILASALKKLYKDQIQITIGPAIKNGFYYDIDANFSITPEDFPVIESEMKKIASQNLPFICEKWTHKQAIDYFTSIHEHYKVEIIKDIIAKDPEAELFVYKHGDFIDLCKGPHFENTKYVKHFKLQSIAGAYWRGNAKNKMLQRIYGTAFFTKDELYQHLKMLEEAEKRDHRKLGKQLHFFHMQEESQGMPFWHANGWQLNIIIEEYIRSIAKRDGYQEVKTPIIYDRTFWEKSGHWEKFHDNMFAFNDGHRDVAVKPMNCPAHVQIFNQEIRSYKELPLRISEFGVCHRNEPTGALFGLMRVRSFRQDDGHIFCTLDQITNEILKFIASLYEVYKKFGFTEVKVKFSDRPLVRAGSDETWNLAENALIDALNASKLEYSVNKGEGAFYGPKIEFTLVDALKREWQCGTAQIDMVLPERLGAFYIDRDGEKKHCVMIHRAILGSFERFIGILIEHYEGKMPFWLSPVQIVILKISDENEKLNEYEQLVKSEAENLARVETYKGSGTINKKIKETIKRKVPIIIIIGQSECENEQIAIRKRDSEEKIIISLYNLRDFIYNYNIN